MAVCAALADDGLGILTETDVAVTWKTKLGVDMAPQVIRGACNPPLAPLALHLEESIGLLLKCNVAVRSVGEGRTHIKALDPLVMVIVTGNKGLETVADDAAPRHHATLRCLESSPTL